MLERPMPVRMLRSRESSCKPEGARGVLFYIQDACPFLLVAVKPRFVYARFVWYDRKNVARYPRRYTNVAKWNNTNNVQWTVHSNADVINHERGCVERLCELDRVGRVRERSSRRFEGSRESSADFGRPSGLCGLSRDKRDEFRVRVPTTRIDFACIGVDE